MRREAKRRPMSNGDLLALVDRASDAIAEGASELLRFEAGRPSSRR
jgi:hypothetical protein